MADVNEGTVITGPASNAGAVTGLNGPASAVGADTDSDGPSDSSGGAVLTNPPNDELGLVTKIIAGTNIAISPLSGQGVVTINAIVPPSFGKISLVNNEASPVTIGAPVYIDAAGGFMLAQANVLASSFPIGLVCDVSIAPGASGNVLMGGELIASTAQWDVITGQVGGLTSGARYWLSPSVMGGLTTIAPITVGQFVARIGIAASPTRMIIEIDDSVLL